jgi:putative ABC transport system substrate-binding protein
MKATSTIPIVMVAISYDPLAKGYVKSLARPTNNVTGISVLSVDVLKKRLQIFKDAFPERRTAFGFWDKESAEYWQIAVETAPSLGLSLFGVELRRLPYDYEAGFQTVPPEYRGALFMPNSAALVGDSVNLTAFALRHRIVSCFDAQSSYLVDGGLMSYGTDLVAAGRRAADYADKIARGAKPADLPIELATRFTLRINLKTAKALGVSFSPMFLATADDVIE